MKRICYQCRATFEPIEDRGEVQCPRCGALQEDLEADVTTHPNSGKGMSSLQDKTEFSGSVGEAPVPDHVADSTTIESALTESAPEDQVEHTPEEAIVEESDPPNQSTQIAPVSSPSLASSPSVPSQSPLRMATVAVGPALLASFIFLGWVVFDKKFRSPGNRFETLLEGSLRLNRTGDKNGAMETLQKAYEKAPESGLVREIYALISVPATPDPVPVPTQAAAPAESPTPATENP